MFSWPLHFPVGAAEGRAPCPTTHHIVSLLPNFIAYDDTVFPTSRELTCSSLSILSVRVNGMDSVTALCTLL
jgi:hypothetical protein